MLWSAAGEAGTFTVTVRTASWRARVEVTGPGPATAPAGESNGWGLDIVRAVTNSAGDSDGPGGSHTSWAEASWSAAGIADRGRRG